MSDYIFYDLPSKGGVCWSYNPWKTRLALNFKKLEYTTAWTEYPSIAETLNPHVPPDTDDPPYTIPALKFPSGDYIMDSKAIITQLETFHPEPSLRLDSPALKEIEAVFSDMARPLRAVALPRVPSILNEPSRVYFERTRSETLGKSLEQYGKEEGGEKAWIAATAGIRAIGELLKRSDGPFLLGEAVSYADFIIAGYLEFLTVLDEELFRKIVGIEPALGRLYKACEPWLKRNSH